MIPLQYNGKDTVFFANPNGRIKQADRKAAKFERVGKLAKEWNQIEIRLLSLLESQQSRPAYACLLMAECGIRIGNEDSAEGYISSIKGKEGQFLQTYGATTLLKEHVRFEGDSMILEFLGKKAVEQCIIIKNPTLVRWGRVFHDSSTDKWLGIDAGDVDRFIERVIDSRLTIKDFRTFCANCRAYQIYMDEVAVNPIPEKKRDLTAEIKKVIAGTAEYLGNTPGICKSAYLSPKLISWIESQRNPIVLENDSNRATKRVERDEKWKKMNEERKAQGLPRINRKRKTRKVKKVVVTPQEKGMTCRVETLLDGQWILFDDYKDRESAEEDIKNFELEDARIIDL
jgi:DNA topoisomerase IB